MALFSIQPTQNTGLLTSSPAPKKSTAQPGPSQYGTFQSALGAFSTPFGQKNPIDINARPIGVRAASATDNVQPKNPILTDKFKAPSQPTPAPFNPQTFSQEQLNSMNNVPGQPLIPKTTSAPVASSLPTVPNAPSMSNQSGQPNLGLYGQLIYSLANQGVNQNPAYTNALQGYNKAVQNLSDFNQQLAKAKGNIETTPIPLEFQQGREQVLARQAAEQQAALQGAINQQQAALGYGLQQQGLNQQALQQAANFAQPQLAGFNQQAFNPVTAQFSGGSNLQDTVNGVADKVRNNTMSYADAVSALSGYGQAGQNALLQALGPSFNVNQNIAQSGVQQQQTQQINQFKSALQQGQNLQSQFTDLIQTFGINPNDVNAVNAGLQSLARNTSDPRYKQFENYINDIANTYAQVLTPVGGSQTDTTRSIAASMLDATSSGQSIIQVMRGLDNAAQAKIAGVSTINTQSNTPFLGAAWRD